MYIGFPIFFLKNSLKNLPDGNVSNDNVPASKWWNHGNS